MTTIIHRKKEKFYNTAKQYNLEIQENEETFFYAVYFKRNPTDLHVIYKDDSINEEMARLNKIERKQNPPI
jgi:predicted transcriptional regulator